MKLPERIEAIDQVEEIMSRPSPELIQEARGWGGDLLILGVAGKMGPTLAMLAVRAATEARAKGRVIGAARFSDPRVRQRLDAVGVHTMATDLLDEAAVDALPDAPNVLFLVGQKFGSTGNEPLTWAMNVHVPALVAKRYRGSRIVALSTGNVYPFSPVDSAGPSEDDPVGPVGEYAQSCLGRERMFQFFSSRFGTLVSLIRLNYAIDLRYGVLLDIATKLHAGTPIDLAMGHVNVIWQGDANTAILRSLGLAANPPAILNLTGPQVLRVRDLAQELGRRLGREPGLTGSEAPAALMSNARKYNDLYAPPTVPLATMLDWVAHWVRIGGSTLNKPTHFEARDGRF